MLERLYIVCPEFVTLHYQLYCIKKVIIIILSRVKNGLFYYITANSMKLYTFVWFFKNIFEIALFQSE